MDHEEQNQPALAGSPRQTPDGAQEQARKVGAELGREAQHMAEAGKESMSARVESLAHAGARAAEDLEARGEDDLAHSLRYAAEKLTELAEGVHRRSVSDLMHDAEQLARRHPALFIGGSVALGLALSRVLKAGRPAARASMPGQAGAYPAVSQP